MEEHPSSAPGPQAPAPEEAAAPQAAPESASGQPPTGREALYRHFDKVPLKVLDAIIAVCVVALIVVLAVGFVQAQGPA